MSCYSLRFSPESKVIGLILRESAVLEEDLQERPHVGCCGLGSSNLEISVREANTNWLVDVEHVDFVVP